MTTSLSKPILFREAQSFSSWLVLIPLAPLCLVWTLVFFDFIWFDFVLSGFIFLGTAVLIMFSKLITELRNDALYVKFAPFHFSFKRFDFSEMISATAREYSVIGEYGGWGIRYGLGGVGKAYNARGNEGVQLVFKDGRKVLIGSQRAKQLAGLIQERLESS